jgi:P4 family phage/plasmid primase-like protien
MEHANKLGEYIESNNFKVKRRDANANFQFLPGGLDLGWSLKVPNEKIPEFLQKYHDYRYVCNAPSHLMEKPMPHFNIIKIDLDLRYLATSEETISGVLKHKYNMNIIKSFIAKYVEKIAEFTSIPEDAKFTITEKKHPRFSNETKKYIKDGMHIICPEIVLPNAVLMKIYNNFIQDEDVNEEFEKFNNCEPIDKAVDSRVIYTNSWFLLGSGKPDDKNKDYYKPTKTYLVSVKKKSSGKIHVDLKSHKLQLEGVDLIMYFTNYGKDKPLELYDEVNLKQLENDFKMGSREPTNKMSEFARNELLRNISKAQFEKEQIDVKFVIGLIRCLRSSRAEVYDEWITIGYCLYNISVKNFSIFVEWSKTCRDKFSEDACFDEWYTKFPKYCEKYSTLNFHMLKRYAEMDNPELYMKLITTNRMQFFDTLIHDMVNNKFDKANREIKFVKAVKEYLRIHSQEQLKCVDIKNNTWYIFRNNRWIKDEGANCIYKIFTNDFQQEFEKIFKKYEQLIKNTEDRIEKRKNRTAIQSIASPNISQLMTGDDDILTETTNENSIMNHDETHDATLLETYRKSQQCLVSLCEFLTKHSQRNNTIKDLCQECFDSTFFKNLDNNPDVFICENVVLDLKTCEVRKGQPNDMNSIYSNIVFPTDDVMTTDEAIDCMEELEEFFDKLFPDINVRNYVLNYVAESLSGEHRREEFAIHTGCGRNGKSVFGNLLKLTLGEYYYEPDSKIYSNYENNVDGAQSIIANIRGKRFINTQEIKNTKHLDTAVIKKMSGGDTLIARFLYKEPFEFKPQGKFNMCCNDIPDLDSNDDGIFRRILVIPYISTFVNNNDSRLDDPVKFPHHYPCDTTITTEKLKRWAPYFLRNLWLRYINLCNHNFEQLKDTNRPKQVKEAINEYIRQSNNYSNFVRDHLQFNPNKKSTYKDISSEFKTYMINLEGKFKATRQTNDNLKREIAKLGGEAKGTGRKLEYYYITINEEGVDI